MRCAIYTRVSTDEQARSDYSSLDRQREICESYINIFREQGWKVAGVYEDGGFSGKDLNRPQLQEMVDDLKAGKLDAIVTYKIDRISRSLKDFYDFWEVLKEHSVTFASATQQFDTSNSTGMLMLNVLLSFAQYEREVTRERTLSKMAGRAERGMWNGGNIPLGFDYSPETKRLQANPDEAPIIKFVFQRIIETRSPSVVAREANSHGYRTKERVVTTRDGTEKPIGANRFDEDTVKAIIRSPLYKGFIRYGANLYPGIHHPIVDETTWDSANRCIGTVRKDDPVRHKDDHVHLLKGILKCGTCGTSMTPYPAGKKDKAGNRYLYYACTSVTQDGSASPCPVRSVPAREFESLIKAVLVDLGSNRAMLEACIETANKEAIESVAELREQQRLNQNQVARLTTSIRRIIEVIKCQEEVGSDLREELQQLGREKEQILTVVEKVQVDIDRRQMKVIDADLIRQSLVDFERLANLLPPDDQKELFHLLLRQVEVWPFDPEQDASLEGAAGAFATKVRSKWYRVAVTLNQLPGLGLSERFSRRSSDFGKDGSPAGIRTPNLSVNSRTLYR